MPRAFRNGGWNVSCLTYMAERVKAMYINKIGYLGVIKRYKRDSEAKIVTKRSDGPNKC